MAYTLNQTVWVYLHRYQAPKLTPFTITKIGRKWISLAREAGGREVYRFDATTLEIDGRDYTSPGEVYLSEEAFTQEQDRKTAWNHLWNQVRHCNHPPAGLTKEAVAEVLKLLGLKPIP